MKSLSGKKLCSILVKKGWILKRINGSHHVFIKLGQEHIIVVPVHKNTDLKIGLLKGIMKLAKIREIDPKNKAVSELLSKIESAK